MKWALLGLAGVLSLADYVEVRFVETRRVGYWLARFSIHHAAF